MMLIDTGTPERVESAFSTLDAWLMGIQDGIPADATERELDRAIADQMLADFAGYRAPVWLRRYWHQRAHIMRDMSERSPEIHDELVFEFIGRLDVLT
jgi:hypothetical protein